MAVQAVASDEVNPGTNFAALSKGRLLYFALQFNGIYFYAALDCTGLSQSRVLPIKSWLILPALPRALFKI